MADGGDCGGVAGDTVDTVDTGDRPRLLLDVMLGKLASYLRMCGYDTAYALDEDIEADDRIRELARAENRVLLTRDRELAERTTNSILLGERDVIDQLRELCDAGFVLELADEPRFCGRCNGRVDSVASDVADEETQTYPDYVPDDKVVWQCRDCGQYFWNGSHWDDVRKRLEHL